MADASNTSQAYGVDLHETRKRLEVLDRNYRNLKGLSQRGWWKIYTKNNLTSLRKSATLFRFICSAVRFFE